MKSRSFCCALCLFVAFALVSCSLGDISLSPPFLLSAPECVLASETGSFEFAGVKFSVRNKSSTEIKNISVVFSVYESESGGKPFLWGNSISSKMECSIESGECAEFEASLDSYIVQVPEEPYYIDYFYLSSAEFSDGYVWHDPTGAFFVRGRK